jgi:acyl-coenzyme A synthetase/AMP-(fatty) acid ligase
VIPGYWNDADTYYRSKLAGYWLSGDLAYREGDDFFHVDRAVDAIRTPDGTGYSVLMEEILLLALPEVTDCAVVAGHHDGVPAPVAVVRVAPDPGQADPAELLARANSALREAGQPPLALLEAARDDSAIPTGATGQVLKRRLREKYADLGAYAASATGGIATSAGDLAAR